ncbi:Nitrogen assimilation regulatory protein [Shimia thalassica]|uniref:Nif-specific regulatory protein n=1 Tax=Shimia thalassica TaxID=1715693 RepID=A0A0P1I701_9RHOB|nr:sigma-54 dependent transcriptional regulator [Shimia thalassica]CUJ94493.1 Nitrogen assimilation regulatory protein [Shimia thalassica]
MINSTVLIIDDEIKLTQSLAFTLNQAGFDCLKAHNGVDGCRIAQREKPDVVLLDIRMPGQNGIEVLQWLIENTPDIPVIMMSAFDDTQDAVTAIKMGAIDYLSKPFDVDELILLIQEVDKRKQLEFEVRYLRDRFTNDTAFIGTSAPIKLLREQIDLITNSQVATVLLSGETGVGKAIIARQLHIKGTSQESPFVEINCATLPESQIEAELFGAEKGALPGLVSRRRGLVEIADGGTLFLDEISQMPLSVQAKLLTYIETRSYRPVGIAREHKSDVRVIAATNNSLEQAVEEGTFRQDLFFRLNVMPVEIPPLRERDTDIQVLANHFAQKFAEDAAVRPIAIGKSALALLKGYPWPGNVRELKNLVERLTILHAGQIIEADHLPSEFKDVEPTGPVSIEDSMQSVERAMIQDALLKSGGKKGMAAERLGISRHALKRKMQRLTLS